MALFLIHGVTTRAAASNYEWMADGAFALDLPDGWERETTENGCQFVLTHRDFDDCVLVVVVPNPVFQGDHWVYLAMNVSYLSMDFDAANRITSIRETLYDDEFPAAEGDFTLDDGSRRGLAGRALVVDFGGYMVSMIALAPAERLSRFMLVARPVMASYVFDRDDADDNLEALTALGNTHMEVVRTVGGETVSFDGTAAGLAETLYLAYRDFVDNDDDSVNNDDDDDNDNATTDPGSVGTWGEPHISPEREWTILVYMDGDNDLEAHALADVKEMEKGLARSDGNTVDVVVLFDRAHGYSDAWDDWTEGRVYHVQANDSDNEFGSRLLRSCGEVNMASARTLEEFILEGTRMFPAPKTAVVLWDHGAGWMSLLNDHDNPDAADDDDDDDSRYMTLEDVRVALSRTAACFPDGKLDLLVMDMCLMGQAETAVAVAPFAKYLVASPALVPSLGFNYEDGLPLFTTGADTATIAAGLADEAVRIYREYDREDGSQAVYDLSRTGTLLTSFSRLARSLNTLIPIAWPSLTRSIFQSINYGGRMDLEERGGTVSSIDVVDWLRVLRRTADADLLREITDDIDAVEQAVGALVIHQVGGEHSGGSAGLAMYAPLREGNMDEDYLSNSFGVYTGWVQMLVDLYVEQQQNAGAPPRIASINVYGWDDDPSPLTAIAIDEYRVDGRVTLVVDGINILYVGVGTAVSADTDPDGPYYLSYRTVLSTSHLLHPESTEEASRIPTFRDGRNTLSCRLDGVAFGFHNGEEVVQVVPRFMDGSNPGRALILGHLIREGTEEELTVILETFQDTIISVRSISTEDDDMTTTDIDPAPGDLFCPVLETVGDDGAVEPEPGNVIPWGRKPSIIAVAPPVGHYFRVVCSAESLAGTGADSVSERWEIVER